MHLIQEKIGNNFIDLYQLYSFQLSWKGTIGYPYRGFPPTKRPDHKIGNSMPYSFRIVRGFFYGPQNC